MKAVLLSSAALATASAFLQNGVAPKCARPAVVRFAPALTTMQVVQQSTSALDDDLFAAAAANPNEAVFIGLDAMAHPANANPEALKSMGLFVNLGHTVNNKPSYNHATLQNVLLWCQNNGDWCIGEAKQVGTGRCLMYNPDSKGATRPQEISGRWNILEGGAGAGWVKNVDVRVEPPRAPDPNARPPPAEPQGENLRARLAREARAGSGVHRDDNRRFLANSGSAAGSPDFAPRAQPSASMSRSDPPSLGGGGRRRDPSASEDFRDPASQRQRQAQQMRTRDGQPSVGGPPRADLGGAAPFTPHPPMGDGPPGANPVPGAGPTFRGRVVPGVPAAAVPKARHPMGAERGAPPPRTRAEPNPTDRDPGPRHLNGPGGMPGGGGPRMGAPPTNPAIDPLLQARVAAARTRGDAATEAKYRDLIAPALQMYGNDEISEEELRARKEQARYEVDGGARNVQALEGAFAEYEAACARRAEALASEDGARAQLEAVLRAVEVDGQGVNMGGAGPGSPVGMSGRGGARGGMPAGMGGANRMERAMQMQMGGGMMPGPMAGGMRGPRPPMAMRGVGPMAGGMVGRSEMMGGGMMEGEPYMDAMPPGMGGMGGMGGMATPGGASNAQPGVSGRDGFSSGGDVRS